VCISTALITRIATSQMPAVSGETTQFDTASSECVASVCHHPMPCNCLLPGLTGVDLHGALLLAHAVSSTRGITIILIAATHTRKDRRDEEEKQQSEYMQRGEEGPVNELHCQRCAAESWAASTKSQSTFAKHSRSRNSRCRTEFAGPTLSRRSSAAAPALVCVRRGPAAA
jgi:hypothetical protein